MPTRDEQINAIMDRLIEGNFANLKILIRAALRQAYNRGYEAGCMQALEQMMEGQGRMNWIPISEQKPPTDGKVLLSSVVFGWHGEGYDEVCIGVYDGNERIKAWMPLPEPYQGGQE